MRGFDQLRTTDFLVSLRAKLGNDQFPVIICQEHAATISNRKDIAPRDWPLCPSGLKRTPNTFSAGQLRANVSPSVAAPVNIVAIKHSGVVDTIDPRSSIVLKREL